MSHTLIELLSILAFLLPAIVFMRRNWIYTLFSFYLAAVYSLVGLPTVLFLRFDITINLVPLLPMIEDLKNSFLNILLFIPLGFFLPLLCTKFRKCSVTLMFGLAMTIAIEVLQMLTYRVTDINDVLTNFLGCWLGYGTFRIADPFISNRLHPSRQCRDIWKTLGAVIFIMFFPQPMLAEFLYRIT